MREMKDSGIEWIGKIPAYWTIKRLKYALSVPMAYGASETGIEFEEDFPRYIRITDIDSEGKLKEEGKLSLSPQIALPYILSDKTVLFARSGGTVGKAFLYKEEYGKAAYAGYLISAVADEDIMYPEWLMYYTGSDSYFDWVQRVFTQATIQNIGADKYSNMPLPIAPIQEQRIIIRHLNDKCSEIDEIKHSIDQEILMLENYKQSIISEAVTKGLNWQAEMQQTKSDEWPQIPVGWSLCDIKYLFEIVKRIAGKEGYDVLSVTQRGLKVKDINSNEGQLADNYSDYQFVYPTDYVMNHMDLLTGWVDCSTLFGVTSPDYRVFRLRDKENNDLNYYKYVMQCCYMCKIFYSLGNGVSGMGRWRLQTSTFMNFQVPVPPLNEQKEIAQYLDRKIAEIDGAIAIKEQQLETLDAYKKSLIFEYVTGKKEVPVNA